MSAFIGSVMSSAREVQDQLITDFELLDSWEDRYTYLLDLAQELPAMGAEYKTDEYKVKGCQSNVWLKPEVKGDLVQFIGDSDSQLVKGLVAMMLRIYSGRTAQEILSTDLYVLKEVGLDKHLSPTRNNGLAAMLKKIKTIAAHV